jgi:hypothetical protein
MTRCLECGTEKSGDQCPHCGLTSAAAEVLFRRKLGRRMAWFLSGSIVFLVVGQIFPPLDLDSMLIFFGLIFFFALGLGFLLNQWARRRGDVEAVKRIYNGFAPLPWIVAVLLFANGKLDHAPPEPHPAVVVGKFQMPGFMRWTRRLAVRSWRENQKLERVSVGQFDFDRFRAGDEIVVQVQPGALGIPWVNGVNRP